MKSNPGYPLSGLRRRASSSHDQPKAVMKILHVISSVNPETGGSIEVITTSASVLSEQGCHQEILSLDSPLDPWSRTVTIKLHAMGIRNPRYRAWRRIIPWLRYGYTPASCSLAQGKRETL